MTKKEKSNKIKLELDVSIISIKFAIREILLQLRESTKASLEAESDPATVLHETCVLVYYMVNNTILNAPGRCVPMILDALKTSINPESHKKLTDFQSNNIDEFKVT